MPRLTTPAGMPPEVRAATAVMSNLARTEMLRLLGKRPMTAPELAIAIDQSAVSAWRHLKSLEDMGLVHADHELGHRTGGVMVRWSTDKARVGELGRLWTRYAKGK